MLGEWGKIPVTYAGGVGSFEDLLELKKLGNNRLNVTIGSALDLFGGPMAYDKVLQYMKKERFLMSRYTKQDIINMVEEEDVEFIRLQFTDMFGTLKNVAITSSQLEKALSNECMFDGSSIEGFVRIEESDMYLYPDLDTFVFSRGDHSREKLQESSVMFIEQTEHLSREIQDTYMRKED